jgi:hypothetical protein
METDMDDLGAGAGFAALGFWLFIAAIIVAGVWDSIRKRESQHETLRRIIESGQTIDDELTDKLLSLTGGASNKNLDRDLKVSGLILLAIAPGLAVFGWIMSLTLAPELLPVMLAVMALLVFVSIGLLGAAHYVRRADSQSGSVVGDQ